MVDERSARADDDPHPAAPGTAKGAPTGASSGAAPQVAGEEAPCVLVRHGVRTDVGCRREHNEDSFGARFPFFVVADGMGGHLDGALASGIVVDQVLGAAPEGGFASAGEVSESIAHAARRVAGLGEVAGPGRRAPGSTLTGLAFSLHRGRPCVRVFNIGDSRTYLLSGSEFSQVTTDHSEVQEMLDAGSVTEVEARALPQRNVITRALGAGAGPVVPADLYVVPALAGDRYLLCSDGLSGEVTDALIEMVTRTVEDPQRVADELVSMALTAGGKDNVTVMVVDIVEASPAWDATAVEGTTLTREGDTSATDDTVPTPEVRRLRESGTGRTVAEEET